MPQLKTYTVCLPNTPEYSRTVRARSRGAAKSQALGDCRGWAPDLRYTDLRARTKHGSTPQDVCDGWNDACPIGARVEYWTGVRRGPGAFGRTTTTARPLGGPQGVAVVWCSGHGACIALTHVRAI